MHYVPLTNSLVCPFCSRSEPIEKSNENIKEYDFHNALKHLNKHQILNIKKEIKCTKCSAIFTLTPYSISSNCPYCDTPAITKFTHDITPESILPFNITHKEAQDRFRKWISSLWFAPTKLKHLVDGHGKLTGYYLPYWTYDAQTTTQYIGQRGDIYYVTVEKTVIINGREEIIQEREPRINWTPVRGIVYNSFDDITVGASKTISHTILDNLAPWDTSKLIPFNEKYLSGFESEEYTIGLDSGFDFAKMQMDITIRQSIKRDIGGDQQQIERKDTTYNHVTYKNTLFPIWTAKFKYKNRVYNYAINAQSGKITGERPYSLVKIISLIIVIMIVGGSIFYYLQEHPQYFEGVIRVN
ncbi:MAG: hypothetical protein KAU90_07145 [Sulfurovaceae bacterium]|nr:hypothetical protein [Sulfurovaceae bacterium]